METHERLLREIHKEIMNINTALSLNKNRVDLDKIHTKLTKIGIEIRKNVDVFKIN